MKSRDHHFLAGLFWGAVLVIALAALGGLIQ